MLAVDLLTLVVYVTVLGFVGWTISLATDNRDPSQSTWGVPLLAILLAGTAVALTLEIVRTLAEILVSLFP